MKVKSLNLERGVLSDLLRELRENRGLTQRIVAEKTRISKKQISAYETARAMPNVVVLNRLLKYYGYCMWVVKR